MNQLFDQIPTSLYLPLLVAIAVMTLAMFLTLGGDGVPRPIAKRYMTQREAAVLDALEQILPAYRFHAQVAMGAILKAPASLNRKPRHSDRNAFSQKIIDFVAQDRATGEIVALIEVDDSSHNLERDTKRDAMTAHAGYRTIRIPKGMRPTIANVLSCVEPLREQMNPAAYGAA